MASALRPAILRHIRLIPAAAAAAAAGSTTLRPILACSSSPAIARRSMSSHDDHLTHQEVVERVLDVVRCFPKVDPSKVTPDAHFQKDLQLDSLDTVEIVMALEEEFKLEIPDKEADKIVSLPLAIEYIAAHPMAG